MKKRILSMLLAIIMVVSMEPGFTLTASAAEISGTTGDCTWTFDDTTGILTISGTGAIATGGNATKYPWYQHKALITKIVIESGVTTIPQYAFYTSSANSVIIPDTVTEIGKSAFYGNANLTSISIPSSVTKIGGTAFKNCNSLETVYTNCNETEWNAKLGKNVFQGTSTEFIYDSPPVTVNYTVTITVSGNGTVSGDGTYPEGDEVTVIATPDTNYKFVHWTENGTPVSTTKIYQFTLTGDCSLTAVFEEFTPNSGACGMDVYYTFDETTGVLTISGTGDMEIYNQGEAPWYSYRDQIKSVVIENGVTSVGQHSFYRCSQLTSITIPGSVTLIGTGAFSECDSLTSVTIPAQITSMGQGVFSGCYNLTDVTISSGVVKLTSNTFGSTALTSITIPASVTKIQFYTFTYCEQLTTVNYLGLEDPISGCDKDDLEALNVFLGCNTTGITVNVPADYQDETFCGLPVNKSGYIVSVTADPAEGGTVSGGGTYEENASVTVTATAASGYSFTGWKENGEIVSTAASYTFNAIENRNLTAVFEAHEHNWMYTASGATITATCSDGYCLEPNGGYVTIAVPTSAEYTGNAIVAEVINQLTTGDAVTVVYSGSSLEAGSKPVKIGTYTATITLGEGENKAEISVTYTITHDNHSFNYTDKEGTTHTASCECGFSETADHNYTYDAENHKCICEKVEQFTITYTDGVDGVVVFADVVLSAEYGTATPSYGTAPTRAGYTFNGWNPEVAATVTGTQIYTAQWTEKQTTSITETAQTYVWDGTAKAFNIVGTTLTGFKVEYSVNGAWTETAPSDVGEYDVKITRAEDNTYKAYSNEISKGLAITPAAITVEVTGIDGWTYGDAADTPAVVVKYNNSELTSGYGAITYTYYTDENCTVKTTATNSGASTEGGVPVNAGTYYVKASVAAAGNYKSAVSDAVSFTIGQKSISDVTISKIADQTYTGEALTPGFTVKDGDTTLSKDVDYTVVYNNNTNAGEAIVTVSGIGNYKDSKEVNFKIIKGDWTTKTASDTAMYNTTGNELDLTSYIAPGGTVGTPVIDAENVLANASVVNGTLTYDVLADVTAASVTVTIPVTGATNHEDYEITVTINLSEKQSQTITVENAAEDKLIFTYGDTDAAISADSNIDDAAISYTVTEGDCISVDASTGKITINKVGTAVITVTAAETDTYAETTKTITVEIKAKQITAPSADSTVFTYNGSEQTYGISATEDYSVSGNKQTNAGNYTVIVELTDKANTVWADTKDTTNKAFAFHIAKAKLTVTADDKEAYVGSRMPELTYTVEGLVDGDTISVELSCDANMNRVGETPIVVTATDESDNYEITTVNGTLTVENYPYIPIITPTYDVEIADDITDGEVSASKKLAYKGDTITITIAPDAGYELTALAVTDSRGNAVAVTKVNDSKYTFKMPGYDVEVDAAFAKIDTACPRDWTCPMYGYTDLDRSLWYHDGIHYCIEHGLMQGVGNNQFAPNGTTTRAMIVTILWRLEGSPVVNYAMSFEDVAADTWYTEAIRWAASEKIVEGYGNGKFGTNDAITREQMVTIMYRYAQYKGYDVSVGENTNILSYDDAFDVAEWAIPAMQWACGSGMIQGIADGSAMNLAPQGNATRAQAAAILQRYCENVANKN